jgi:D-amino-acid dehydrogenase
MKYITGEGLGSRDGTMTTLIVGAGIVGVCLAWELSSLGERVIVVDRAPEPAGEASRANTGMITPSQSAPWASPGMPRRLLGLLLRDSHLKLRLRGMSLVLGWGSRFFQHCTDENHRRALAVNLRLANFSRERLRALRHELGFPYDHASVGTLRVFWSASAFDKAVRAAEEARALGVAFRALTRGASVDLDPTLSALGNAIAGSIHFPDDETGDCAKFAAALAERSEQVGVQFHWATTVRGFATEGGKIVYAETNRAPIAADRFVLAAGCESPRLSRPLGVRLPIAPIKGYSLTATVSRPDSLPCIPRIDEERAIGITPLGTRLRVGGFIEVAGFDTQVVPAQINRMVEAALAVCPSLTGALDSSSVHPWACLRPLTVDGPPLLGATAIPNLFLNTGHGSMGWTMACGSASAVAAVIMDRVPPIDLDGLTLNRFC